MIVQEKLLNITIRMMRKLLAKVQLKLHTTMTIKRDLPGRFLLILKRDFVKMLIKVLAGQEDVLLLKKIMKNINRGKYSPFGITNMIKVANWLRNLRLYLILLRIDIPISMMKKED